MENHQTVQPSAGRNLQAQLSPHIDEIETSLSLLSERALTFIRDRPGTALLGAVALGFIVGKIAAKS